MAGDFEPTTKMPDPAEAATTSHREGYTTADLAAVITRVEKWQGHGLRPAEVKTLYLGLLSYVTSLNEVKIEMGRLRELADENDGHAKRHAAEVNELRHELALLADGNNAVRMLFDMHNRLCTVEDEHNADRAQWMRRDAALTLSLQKERRWHAHASRDLWKAQEEIQRLNDAARRTAAVVNEIVRPENGCCNQCGGHWLYRTDGSWRYAEGEHTQVCRDHFERILT